MRKKFGFIALTLVASMSFFGCTDEKNEEQIATDEKLEVVASNFAAYDFTKQVVGDNAEVELLLPPGAESHSYEPTPQDIIAIQEADIFIYIGGEGDTWVDKILSGMDTENLEVIKMIDCVDLFEEEIVEGMTHEHEHSHGEGHNHDEQHEHEEEEHSHDEEHEHEEEEHSHDEEHEHEEEEDSHDEEHEHEGEEHSHDEEHEHEEEVHSHDGEKEYDEHVWTSPKNAAKIVSKISEEAMSKDEANAKSYEENTKEYIQELEELDKAFEDVVKNGKRKEVIFADRFPVRYFVEEYGLDYYAAFPGCAADAEPSAATVAFLIDKVKEDNIPAVFHIELSNEKMADTIVEATGVKKLLFSAAHNVTKEQFEAGITYLDIMKDNVETLKEALN